MQPNRSSILVRCFVGRVVVLLCALTMLATTASAAESEPFETIQVTDQIYVLRHEGHMNLFLVTDDGIVVVDPLNPEAAAHLVGELHRLAPGKKLLAIIYSHYHSDHAGGARALLDAYGDNVPIVANKRTAELLADKNWPSMVKPNQLIEPPWSIQAGDLTLEMRHVGPNHSSDMLIGWIPQVQLVYLVDFVGNKGVGYQDLPGVYLPEYWESQEAVLELPIKIATFGHGRPGTKADIEEHANFWRKLRAAARDAIANGLTEDQAAASIKLSEYSHWRMYDEWFPQNVRGVYRYEKSAAGN